MARQITKPLPIGFTGVRAEETPQSRLGIQSGIFGVYGATRIWRVYTAAPHDNPLQTMRTLPTNLGGTREGDNYPWREMSQMVLLYFTLLEHWTGTNVWIVEGTYGPPILFQQTANLWSFRLNGSLETEHVWSELPIRVGDALLPGRGIGVPKYEPKPPTDTVGDFQSMTEKGFRYFNLPNKVKTPFGRLLPRHLEGASRMKRTGTLQLTKTIPAWNHNAVRSALAHLNTVNSDLFHTATIAGDLAWADEPSVQGEGVMMFVDLAVEPVQAASSSDFPAPLPPGVIAGISFNVTLTFKYSADGWRYRRTHTAKNVDDGTEGPVTIVGSGIIDNNGDGIATPEFYESFTLYPSDSLSAIVEAFV